MYRFYLACNYGFSNKEKRMLFECVSDYEAIYRYPGGECCHDLETINKYFEIIEK